MPCTPAISSHSLGRAWVHDMPSKLDQAARYGLDIELFYEDLYYVASSLAGGATPENQIEAAKLIRSMCEDRNICIVCLQPFMHYEGLRDRQRHSQRVEEMKLWIKLAKVLRTHIISIPSTCLSKEEVSGDLDLIVSDMREVADLAAVEGIKIAYEALAWGTYVDTWELAYEIVQRVDRSNFGICLDTFNIAARVYADPTTPSRRNTDAEAMMRESIDRLVKTVAVDKIMYVQVVDAEYLAEPLVEGHRLFNSSQRSRMSWSRNCRLFYGEDARGAYLPVHDILRAIIDRLGFSGWISAELFNESLTSADKSVPADHARRAAQSWEKIVNDFNVEVVSQCEKKRASRRRSTVESVSRAQL
jgi:4-hydroxyphenylpyruvate dioxygenase